MRLATQICALYVHNSHKTSWPCYRVVSPKKRTTEPKKKIPACMHLLCTNSTDAPGSNPMTVGRLEYVARKMGDNKPEEVVTPRSKRANLYAFPENVKVRLAQQEQSPPPFFIVNFILLHLTATQTNMHAYIRARTHTESPHGCKPGRRHTRHWRSCALHHRHRGGGAAHRVQTQEHRGGADGVD